MDLRSATIKGRPVVQDSAALNNFRFGVKDFFLGELLRIDLSNSYIKQPKVSEFNFDLHLIGIGDKGDIFESPTYLFRCTAYESRIKTLKFGYQRKDDHSILPTRVYVPGAPALKALTISPREDYNFSKVGTIIGLRENPLAFEIHPYWGSDGLEVGMQHLVDLAKDLLRKDSIAQSEVSGSGKTVFEHASAIINIVYHNIANFCINSFPNETIDGISAIYIEKIKLDSFYCRLAVVSLVGEEICNPAVAGFNAKSRQHRVFDLSLKRDHYGFLEVSIKGSETKPFYSMDWPDRMANII